MLLSETLVQLVADNDAPLVIAVAAELHGELRTPEALVLNGYVDGLLRAKSVLVAISGEMTGTIVSETVTIEGCLEATDIFANLVVLRSGCHVTGRIFCRALEIHPGALFEGAHRRHDNPIGLSNVDA